MRCLLYINSMEMSLEELSRKNLIGLGENNQFGDFVIEMLQRQFLKIGGQKFLDFRIKQSIKIMKVAGNDEILLYFLDTGCKC